MTHFKFHQLNILIIILTITFFFNLFHLSEKLLKTFLNHKSLMTEEDWKIIFLDFVSQISEYTGKDVKNTLKPEFTTTTPVSLAVGQLTIMATMKHYFNYKVFVIGYGFPHITIEGSIEDWTKIVDKLSNLAKYQFELFTGKIISNINEIIETKKGYINNEFWKRMLKI